MKNSPISYRSSCPITMGLDVFGDKWTLIILRDLCMGKCRYKQFQDSPEKIPTNILASRLKKLVDQGCVVKKAYQERPVRYEYILTPKGRDVIPILQDIARWTGKHEPSCWQPPEDFWKMRP